MEKQKMDYEQLALDIKNGYDVNQLAKGMRSLLHNAASDDALDIARLLINNNANVEIKDRRHETPLHYAATGDSKSVAKLLIDNGANVNARNKYGTTPIHSAARQVSLSVLELLIANGADVNARDAKNNTPLHDAMAVSSFFVARTKNINIMPVINALLNHGAEVNAVGETGNTPLHVAASHGLEEVIDSLLKAGADETIVDSNGDRPEDSVFSLSDQYFGATLRTAIDHTVGAHLKTLSRKRMQFIQVGDYGEVDDSKWNDELEYFVMHVLVPKLRLYPSNRYISWVLNRIYADDNIAVMERDNILKAVDEKIDEKTEETSFDIDEYSYSDDMNPIEYEIMCSDILSRNGWNTRITSKSGDQGVDIFAEKDGRSVTLQCKRYSSPVGNKAVQEAHAGMGFMGATTAAVVTNSSYTQSAKQLAATLGILLLHHDELGDL